LILECVVHPADVQDRDGARLVLEGIVERFPRLQKIWADGGYAGKLVEWAKELGQWVLEIVKRSDTAVGFEVLPHRWIVERTFAWLGRYRRNSRDYEWSTGSSEAMIKVCSIHRMLRLLAPDRSRKPVPFKYRELQAIIPG
jgi:putative transposase